MRRDSVADSSHACASCGTAARASLNAAAASVSRPRDTSALARSSWSAPDSSASPAASACPASILTADVVSVVDLDVPVATDTHLVLDGRTANEVTYTAPEETEVSDAVVDLTRVTDFSGVSTAWFIDGGARIFAAESDPAVIGDFEYKTQWNARGAARDYWLVYPERGAIPADLSYEVTRDTSAEITSPPFRLPSAQ